MSKPTIYRSLTLKARAIDEEKRTVSAVLSTDTPIERGDYIEILDHSGVDLSRAVRGLPFIESHDAGKVNIGKVENIKVEDGRMIGDVRFGQSKRAAELFRDVADNIVDGVSIGYIVREWDVNHDKNTYTARSWMPFEVSAVSIPADSNAGFFRSIDAIKAPEEAKPSEETVIDAEPPVQEEDKTAERQLDNTQTEVTIMSDEKQTPEVDIEAVRGDSAAQERKRISEITKIGEKFGKSDLANQFVENGKTVGDFQRAMLEDMEGVKVRATGPNNIGLTEKEKQQYSFIRAISAQLPNASAKDREAAAFEREVSEAAQKQYGRTAQGFMIPDDVSFKRDLTAGSSTQGADVVDTLGLRPESFIDLLRNVQVVEQAGATVFTGLQGDVAIPRQTGGSTAYWVAENGVVTESDQTFDQVVMSPETVGAVTEISRRLLIQSSIDIEAFVRQDLARQIGIEIDRVAINGSGSSNQPEGILQTSGIGAYSASASDDAATWAMIVGLWKEVAKDNAAMGSLAWLASAPVIAELMNTKKDTGSGRFVMENLTDGLLSYPVYVSENVPSDLSTSNDGALIFGNFSDLLIGYWSGVDVLVDPYSNSKTGAVRVVTMVDCDVDLRHAQSFAAIQDITLS